MYHVQSLVSGSRQGVVDVGARGSPGGIAVPRADRRLNFHAKIKRRARARAAFAVQVPVVAVALHQCAMLVDLTASPSEREGDYAFFSPSDTPSLLSPAPSNTDWVTRAHVLFERSLRGCRVREVRLVLQTLNNDESAQVGLCACKHSHGCSRCRSRLHWDKYVSA
jgi:hypothetical protein